MNTIPDTFHRRAQWQNNAINHADAYLLAADMPSYTDVVAQLADMLNTSRTATETLEVTDKARAMVASACGMGRPDKRQREYLAMKLATAFRRPSIFQAVEEITGKGNFRAEDIGVMHGLITVATEHVEAVRAAVDKICVMGQRIDVVGAAQ